MLTPYAVALANPILKASSSPNPSKSKTATDDKIARGYDNAIVALAIDLPKTLTVKSIASTTIGNENADHVNFMLYTSNGKDTRKLETVITMI